MGRASCPLLLLLDELVLVSSSSTHSIDAFPYGYIIYVKTSTYTYSERPNKKLSGISSLLLQLATGYLFWDTLYYQVINMY